VTALDVINGRGRWAAEASDALLWLRGLPDRCCSLVLFSPPYENQRTYSVGYKTKGQAWVDWMRPVVCEAARVCSGLVVVNAAGPVRGGSYSPSMEWLVSDLTRLDGLVCGPAPWCWNKVCGIPGSGGKRYQRRDWEPLYAFCLPDRLPLAWSDNTAFGRPPRWNPGGEMSNRKTDGSRVNDPWKTASRGGSGCGGRRANGEKQAGPKGLPVGKLPGPTRRAGGEYRVPTRHTKRVPGPDGDVMREQYYTPPPLANPGNVIKARVGGGHMGSRLAHESEAPMQLGIAERFVCWYAAPDSVVCDPFAGSGTTLHAAILHGRRGIGCDVRQSQCDLVARRLATVTPSLFTGG
jgi:hypothetical protein